jgi:hypothetical protein
LIPETPLESRSTIRFTATLSPLEEGRVESGFLLALPEDASATLPSRGPLMIEGTINGFPFRAPLEPHGEEGHVLRVDADLWAAARAAAGDSVVVEITRVGEEAETRVPVELTEALVKDPSARAVWEETTPAARRDWVLWICSAKQTETRQHRIETACDKLGSGMRRVCCFGGLSWLRKDHPGAGETWLPLPGTSRRQP